MQEILKSGRIPPNEDAPFTDYTVNCTFAVYGQMASVPFHSTQIEEYERELRHPSGAATAQLPLLDFTAYMHSENCQLLLQIEHAKGLPMDRFWQKAVHYAAILSLVSIAQILLLIRQMQKVSSPSVRIVCHKTSGGN